MIATSCWHVTSRRPAALCAPRTRWLAIAVWLAAIRLAFGQACDTVVVCPAAFQPTMQSWVAYRTAQGHVIRMIDSSASAAAIVDQIRRAAGDGALRFVVLVGDVPQREDEPQRLPPAVPTHYVAARVNRRWGSEPYIATDNGYADLDGDGVPDVAVGRLTADDPAELQRMIRKIVEYEQSSDFGSWRRDLHVVAGPGNFNPVLDALLEWTARRLLTQLVPESYRTTMTYARWQSPYCPDPRRFRQTAIERLSGGCVFWVYVGHGHPWALDIVRSPAGDHPVLECDDALRLASRHAPPIALLLACYTGAVDAPRDCLGEHLLRSPRGPVAVVCGSRVTMPYGMTVLACQLVQEYFHAQPATLGQLVLAAKRRCLIAPDEGEPSASARKWIDALAGALASDAEQLQTERQEHVQLFNLLGDPLLRLRYPQSVQLSGPTRARAGEPLVVSGVAPIEGRLTIELVWRRGRIPFSLPDRSRLTDADAQLSECDRLYRLINDTCWAKCEMDVPAGPFEAQLAVPAEAHGACQLRAFLEGQGQFAVGSCGLLVERTPPPTTHEIADPKADGAAAVGR